MLLSSTPHTHTHKKKEIWQPYSLADGVRYLCGTEPQRSTAVKLTDKTHTHTHTAICYNDSHCSFKLYLLSCWLSNSLFTLDIWMVLTRKVVFYVFVGILNKEKIKNFLSITEVKVTVRFGC